MAEADIYYVQALLLDWMDCGQKTVPPDSQHPVDGSSLGAGGNGRCKWEWLVCVGGDLSAFSQFLHLLRPGESQEVLLSQELNSELD